MKETKFKQTEVGLIPSDWEVKPFKQVATLINGRAYSQNELLAQGKYKILRVGNFGTNDNWYYSNLELDNKQYCEKGDLLYCWSCTYGAYIWNEDKTIYHYHIWKILNKNSDKIFLKYILNNDTANQMNSSNGSTMAHITKGFLENRLFSFPPTVEEQKRIAQALSDVDSVISTTEKLIAKKKALKQGTMQTLLSGKMRIQNGKWIKTTHFKQTELGPIPQEWEVKSLGSITQNSSYGVGAEAIPFNGKAKYIRITDIDDDSHRFEPSPLTSPAFYENKHLVQENDLLIARTGASVGKTYLYNAKDGKLVFAGFLIKMNICGADSKFVFYSTLTKYYQDWIVSESARTGQPGVNLQQMKKLLIAIPSSKAEQTAIATVLSDMDSEITTLETKLAKYRQLKTGMMQQLLTGKVRLI